MILVIYSTDIPFYIGSVPIPPGFIFGFSSWFNIDRKELTDIGYTEPHRYVYHEEAFIDYEIL